MISKKNCASPPPPPTPPAAEMSGFVLSAITEPFFEIEPQFFFNLLKYPLSQIFFEIKAQNFYPNFLF